MTGNYYICFSTTKINEKARNMKRKRTAIFLLAALLLALALSTLLHVLYFLYTTLLLWVPEAETEHTRRLRWVSVPGLVFVALNIAVGLRSYGLMDLFRQGMDLFCQ